MSLACTCMSCVCHSYVLVCHSYVTHMYSYVIRMSLVCHPYVTRMYSYVIRMWLVCTRLSSYVIRMRFYHEPFKNIPLFMRSARFYVTVPGDFERIDFSLLWLWKMFSGKLNIFNWSTISHLQVRRFVKNNRIGSTKLTLSQRTEFFF